MSLWFRQNLLSLLSVLATVSFTINGASAEPTPLTEALPLALSDASEDSIQLEMEATSYQSCLPCHGPKAEGNRAQRAPSLAGQHPWYLERQLEYFRKGVRGAYPGDIHGAAMQPMAMLLNDAKNQEAILQEIAEFPTPTPKKELNGNVQAGAEIYLTSCLNCHGEDAAGMEQFNAPKLNTLPDWYIVRQLRKFQLGYRGSHEADLTGLEMRPMAMALNTETKLKDVAAYITSLRKAND